MHLAAEGFDQQALLVRHRNDGHRQEALKIGRFLHHLEHSAGVAAELLQKTRLAKGEFFERLGVALGYLFAVFALLHGLVQ